MIAREMAGSERWMSPESARGCAAGSAAWPGLTGVTRVAVVDRAGVQRAIISSW